MSYGGCSSGVEYKIVDLVVAGSRPVIHPIAKKAFVAHLDRVPDFESVGSRFESCRTQAANSLYAINSHMGVAFQTPFLMHPYFAA